MGAAGTGVDPTEFAAAVDIRTRLRALTLATLIPVAAFGMVGTWVLASSPSEPQREGSALAFEENKTFTYVFGGQSQQGHWELTGWKLKLDAQESNIDSLDGKTLKIKTKDGMEIWSKP